MTCGHYTSLQWSFATLSVVLPILEHLKEKKSSITDAIEAAFDGHFPNYLLLSLSNKNLYNIFCTLSRGVQPLTRANDLWLASLDFLALCIFIWQETTEYFSGPVDTVEACDMVSSARLWFALTIRQSCLMVVSGLMLLHIRMGHSVSFGAKQWMIWAPMLLLSIMSTVLAAVLSGASIPSLFIGLVAYLSTTAMLSVAAFSGLVYTLVSIHHNLTALHKSANSWPPAKEVREKPRHSLLTEDIDALQEGSSWLTSDAGSHCDEVSSNWSFSTYHTQHGCPSPQDPSVPPVPPLPSPYCSSTSPTCVIGDDPDLFCRDIPIHPRLGSQSSWLTSSTAWSFPTAHQVESTVDVRVGLLPATLGSRPATPTALLTAQVLGGYGYTADSEKGIASLTTKGSGVEISYTRYMSWLLSIWVPMALSLPYLISLSTPGFVPGDTLSVLLVLLVTLSSLLLAINILLRSLIPIPTGLFDVHMKPPLAVVLHTPSPADTLAMYVRDYKGSGSVTIVEGHHSRDVWISQGDAIDGKGKVGRAPGLMSSIPRLAILPIGKEKDEGECEETYASRIMIAQRHYSMLATTVVIPASPERQEDPIDAMTLIATGVAVESSVAPGGTSHLCARSISSVISQAITMEDLDISPPPSDLLPLTLPNVRNVKLAKQLMHKKSYLSGFSLGAVVSEDMNKIDMLPAGVLPLLVPGLKVSEGMKIKEWEFLPPLSSTIARKPHHAPKESNGSDFAAFYTCPGALLRQEDLCSQEESLQSSQDALQSWKSEVNWALVNKIHQYSTLPVNDNTQRNMVWGGESVPNLIAHPCAGESQLQVPTSGASLGHSLSTHILGLRPKVPHSVDSTYISNLYSFTLQYTLLATSLHIYVKNSWVFQMVQLKQGPEMNGKMGNMFEFLHSDRLRSTLPGCPCIRDVEMGNTMQDIKVSLCKLRMGLNGAKKLLGSLLGGQMHYAVKSGLQPRICQTRTHLATSRKRGYRHSSNAMIVLLGVVVGLTQHYTLLALHNSQALVKFMRQEIMLYLYALLALHNGQALVKFMRQEIMLYLYALLALHNGQALVKFMRQETMLYLVHTVNLPMTVKDRVNGFFSSICTASPLQQPGSVKVYETESAFFCTACMGTQWTFDDTVFCNLRSCDAAAFVSLTKTNTYMKHGSYQPCISTLLKFLCEIPVMLQKSRQDLHTEVHDPNRVKPRGDTKYVRHCEVQ
ncbi:hypothetical protein F5141DRAFT_1063160 [Pisolithus sp. B1]|nr:hypothetical protein F5141DRAFT_1063160 [Pisolithus sp. B1]